MTVVDRLIEFRNRLIGDPDFRRRLQRLPIIQSFADRSAEQLFQLCSGFIHSQVLFLCARLGLIELLEERDRSLAELTEATGIAEERLEKVLQAATALRVLERRADGAYRLGVLGAAQCGNAGLKALILHHDALYRDLIDPVAMASETREATRLGQYWAYASSTAPAAVDEDAVAPYSAVMGASQRMIAEQLADIRVFRRCRRLLDVGGGNGTLAMAIAERHPHLDVTIADLPAVAEIARKNAERAGLDERIAAVGLDFFEAALPTGHDALSFVRVLHDHDDAAAASLLRSAHDALAPGATLVVAEPLAASDAAGRLIDAYFSIYLLAMGQGRPRTFGELKRMLKTAGFGRVRRLAGPSPIICSVITARRR